MVSMDAGFVYIVWYWMDGPIEIQLGKASTKEWMGSRMLLLFAFVYHVYIIYKLNMSKYV